MAICVIHSRVSSFWCLSTRSIAATMNVPNIHVTKITTTPSSLVADLDYLNNFTSSTTTTTKHYTNNNNNNNSNNSTTLTQKSMEIVKLHLIMEIVSDRLEMHKNVAAQRDNWNHLLLTSVNMITLSASTMLALAATSTTSSGAPLMALKVSSTVLFMAATGILAVMNKFQPSQLAEEQRNAARLFKQLHGELRTKVSLGSANEFDVTEAMEKVLALDKAYPLPLLGTLLDKFPHKVEPAVWWPQRKKKHHWKEVGDNKDNSNNGWDSRLEGEMKAIVKALRKKDMAEYMRLSRKALNLNKVLAVSGPLLTGFAAIGSACLGCVNGSWPVMFGVVGGALACVVNTVEHGGQVGMVFELYRSLIGFFKLMEESIQQNLREKDLHRRENGELFEIKVALQLGKSLEELRNFSSSTQNDFASKLF